MPARCLICRAKLTRSRRTYCSDLCASDGHNRKRRIRQPRRRRCKSCRAWFPPARHGHVFCSVACKQATTRYRAKAQLNALLFGRIPPELLYALRSDVTRITAARDAFNPADALSKAENAAADAFERAEIPYTRDSLLRKAGLDPRAPRREGRAVRPRKRRQ